MSVRHLSPAATLESRAAKGARAFPWADARSFPRPSLCFDDYDGDVVARARLQRRIDERLRTLLHVFAAHQFGDERIRQLTSETVGAQQVTIAESNAIATHVQQQRVLAADRARDRMIRFFVRLLQIQLGSPGVIGRHLRESLVTQAIDAAVAGPHDRTGRALHEKDGDGAAADDGIVLANRRLVQPGVDLGHALADRVAGRFQGRGAVQVLQAFADPAARDIAVAVAAHAVRDGPDAARTELPERILVAGPYA